MKSLRKNASRGGAAREKCPDEKGLVGGNVGAEGCVFLVPCEREGDGAYDGVKHSFREEWERGARGG